MILLIATILITMLGLAVIVRKLARQFASPAYLPAGTAWIDELSIERYRPMFRLLKEQDFQFLSTQPGFTPAMANKLRIQRCQIFREYLRDMDADFGRICMALKALLVTSETDRSDLASVLVQRQLTFKYTMIQLHLRVVLFRYGMGAVDVNPLVSLFDGMRIQLQTLVPADSMAGV